MPTVTENVIQGWASCHDGRCPGYKQQQADAVVTTTAFTYYDFGGDVPGIERESILIRFANEADIPCPVCEGPRLVSDQVRPIYPNVSGVPQDALLMVGRDSERVRDLQMDNANQKAENSEMRRMLERQQQQLDQLMVSTGPAGGRTRGRPAKDEPEE